MDRDTNRNRIGDTRKVLEIEIEIESERERRKTEKEYQRKREKEEKKERDQSFIATNKALCVLFLSKIESDFDIETQSNQ